MIGQEQKRFYNLTIGKGKGDKNMLTQNAAIETVQNYTDEIEEHGVHLR